MRKMIQHLREYETAYYQANSKREMGQVSDFIQKLGYTCVDNQTHPTSTYWGYMVINHNYKKGLEEGVFYINGTTPSVSAHSCLETRFVSFWDRNRFLDYCILHAPDPRPYSDRYYNVDGIKGHSNMIKSPYSKDIPFSNLIRMSTAAEVNLKYIREGDFAFPNEYYDILTDTIINNEFYGY